MVSHQSCLKKALGGLSSRWSQESPGWSLIKMVSRESWVVSHQGGVKRVLGGLSSRWSQESPGWSLQGGLKRVLGGLFKVVSREPWVVLSMWSQESPGWSHQGGLKRALCERKEAGFGLVPTMAELVTPDFNHVVL